MGAKLKSETEHRLLTMKELKFGELAVITDKTSINRGAIVTKISTEKPGCIVLGDIDCSYILGEYGHMEVRVLQPGELIEVV